MVGISSQDRISILSRIEYPPVGVSSVVKMNWYKVIKEIRKPAPHCGYCTFELCRIVILDRTNVRLAQALGNTLSALVPLVLITDNTYSLLGTLLFKCVAHTICFTSTCKSAN